MNPGLAKLPAVAAALPGATEDIKWEADRVFSVGAKMFAVFHPAKGRPTQCSFKVEDERFLELTGLPGIQPESKYKAVVEAMKTSKKPVSVTWLGCNSLFEWHPVGGPGFGNMKASMEPLIEGSEDVPQRSLAATA